MKSTESSMLKHAVRKNKLGVGGWFAILKEKFKEGSQSHDLQEWRVPFWTHGRKAFWEEGRVRAERSSWVRCQHEESSWRPACHDEVWKVWKVEKWGEGRGLHLHSE